MYLPNLLEFLFLTVFALPKASRIGLQPIILSDNSDFSEFTLVNKLRQYLAFSVLPAPLSPDITIAYILSLSLVNAYAATA